MGKVGPMLRFTAAVRISTRTTTAWGRRRSSIMEFLAGLRNLPSGDSLPIFLSIKVHLFAMGLVPDTHSKFYAFILQRRKRSCLLLFFLSTSLEMGTVRLMTMPVRKHIIYIVPIMWQVPWPPWDKELQQHGYSAREGEPKTERQQDKRGRGPQTKALFHGT